MLKFENNRIWNAASARHAPIAYNMYGNIKSIFTFCSIETEKVCIEKEVI